MLPSGVERLFPISLCLTALLAWAAAAPARAADVKLVALDPHEGLEHNQLIARSAQSGQFERSGTLQVCTFPAGSGSVKAALVRRNASADMPDAALVDLAGTGDFAKQQVIKFRPAGGGAAGVFIAGPATLQITRDGKTLPVFVQVEYSFSKGVNTVSQTLELHMGLGAQGPCKFGAKTYTVRLVDTSGDLDLTTSPTPPTGKGASNVPAQFGDTVIVQVGSKAVKGYYGQPMFVDGAWYTVKLDTSTMSLTAEPTSVDAGKLLVAHDNWRAVLTGKKYVLALQGDAQPIPVPCDEYRITSYEERAGPVVAGKQAVLRCSAFSTYSIADDTIADAASPPKPAGPKAAPAPTATPAPLESAIVVKPGETVKLAIGSPLVPGVTAEQSGKYLTLGLLVKEQSGTPLREIVLGTGQRPNAPEIQIFNEDKSKLIYRGRLEYG